MRAQNKHLILSVCPIKQNYHEIPVLVEYCNEHEILIFFDDVFEPEFSLKYLPAEELAKIADMFKSSMPAAKSGIETENKRRFENLTRQITSWMKKSKNDKKQPEK